VKGKDIELACAAISWHAMAAFIRKVSRPPTMINGEEWGNKEQMQKFSSLIV
jgi:hypothetical protein